MEEGLKIMSQEKLIILQQICNFVTIVDFLNVKILSGGVHLLLDFNNLL